jgi:hypothetical protein
VRRDLLFQSLDGGLYGHSCSFFKSDRNSILAYVC